MNASKKETFIWKQCRGPGLLGTSIEKCISATQIGEDGWHKVRPEGVDVRPYNGIQAWRCPTCFAEHRRRIDTSRK